MSGVTEDCNCPIPAGSVKAQRVAGGSAAGNWGSVVQGGWAILPRSVVERNPEYWAVQAPEATQARESNTGALQDLDSLTVPELTALAAERGVELPSKARKAEIVQVLTNAA